MTSNRLNRITKPKSKQNSKAKISSSQLQKYEDQDVRPEQEEGKLVCKQAIALNQLYYSYQ